MTDRLLFQTGRFRLSWAWYDLWLGLFIDSAKKRLYFCPLPTLLITYNYG